MKHIVVVDIDGTVSKVGERLKYLQQSPKDWDSFYNDCFEDEPIPEMVNLVINLYQSGYEIIFCTGRRESCRKKTVKWLNKHLEFERLNNRSGSLSKERVVYSLLMRHNGDHRHDTLVKPELLNDVCGLIFKNDIAFVLEDRNSMVAKWRELGLICLQVAEGDF